MMLYIEKKFLVSLLLGLFNNVYYINLKVPKKALLVKSADELFDNSWLDLKYTDA